MRTIIRSHFEFLVMMILDEGHKDVYDTFEAPLDGLGGIAVALFAPIWRHALDSMLPTIPTPSTAFALVHKMRIALLAMRYQYWTRWKWQKALVEMFAQLTEIPCFWQYDIMNFPFSRPEIVATIFRKLCNSCWIGLEHILDLQYYCSAMCTFCFNAILLGQRWLLLNHYVPSNRFDLWHKICISHGYGVD